jgi:uncharacterized protein YlaN (UPF0358 family)
MSRCDHKTEAEYGVCNRCRQFAVIARNARILLQKRKVYLDNLLVPSAKLDQAQMAMQEALQNLERSVDFATQSSLWDD